MDANRETILVPLTLDNSLPKALITRGNKMTNRLSKVWLTLAEPTIAKREN